MDALNLSHLAGFLIRRAQQAHVAAWNSQVSTETTSVQFGVLNVLREYAGLSQRDLCDKLDLDRSTIGDLVVRLQGKGFVVRVRATDDRRRNVLDLTPLGHSEFRRLVNSVCDVDATLNQSLSQYEAVELRRLLIKVIDSVPTPSPVDH